MPVHLSNSDAATIIGLLTDIRDELRLLNEPLPDAGADEPGCDHEMRLDLSSLGGGEHWICQGCGLEYRASTALSGARES